MKILLFGGSGQLGYEVTYRARDLHFDMVAPHESELDIGDGPQVTALVNRINPDVILNCAAYTAVDQAEAQPELAFRVNRDGVRNIALAAKEARCRLLHISTDYVFDGQAREPIPETAQTGPLNVYGASKLAGEEVALRLLGDQALIVRTQSLHGQRGTNFVHTMLKLFTERDVVKVVSDQFMCATWAGWLAEVLLDLVRLNTSGIYHAAGDGVISWHQFAVGIYELSRRRIGREVQIEPVSTAEFPRPARRPVYSALDCKKLSALLGRKPISWEEGLRRHMDELGYRN